MPIKKGKNKGKPSNIEKYDTGREQVYTKVLNLQNQINQLALFEIFHKCKLFHRKLNYETNTNLHTFTRSSLC